VCGWRSVRKRSSVYPLYFERGGVVDCCGYFCGTHLLCGCDNADAFPTIRCSIVGCHDAGDCFRGTRRLCVTGQLHSGASRGFGESGGGAAGGVVGLRGWIDGSRRRRKRIKWFGIGGYKDSQVLIRFNRGRRDQALRGLSTCFVENNDVIALPLGSGTLPRTIL
jgi:hypothetical protein